MRNDPKIKPDGYANFLGGIDSGLTPNSIAANAVSYAWNVSFRNGWAASRPGFTRRTLVFERSEAQDWFETHGFQGAGTFGDGIAVSCGGRVFLIDVVDGFKVTEITPWKTATTVGAHISPPTGNSVSLTVDDASAVQDGLPIFILDGYYTVTSHTVTNITAVNIDATPGLAIPNGTAFRYLDPNSDTVQMAYFQQVDDSLIVQDGRSRAIIYANSTSRRSNAAIREVPTGTVMAYGHGRLWVAIGNYEFVAGDINNSKTSTALLFTENEYLSGGGSFRVPSSAGKITAMTFIAELDKALGQGPLMVFTDRGVFSVNAPVEREAWAVVTNPIITQTVIEHGAQSHRGTLLVNGDIFYRGRDGVRSLILAVREFGGWGNTPVSGEMDGVLAYDEESLLGFHSAVVFDNRLLFTVQPHPNGAFCYHEAIGVLDFKPLSGVSRQAGPVWNGVWGGIKPTQLVQGVFGGRERCFAFAYNSSGENELWEISKSNEFDNNNNFIDRLFDNGIGRIESFIDTRSFGWGSNYEAKKLYGLEMWYDGLRGTVDFEARYRPDQYPCWFDWITWNECQTGRDCAADGASCYVPTSYASGYRTRKSLPQPSSTCIPMDNKPSAIGYEFQVRIKWTGRARLKWLMIKAQEIDEDTNGNLVC